MATIDDYTIEIRKDKEKKHIISRLLRSEDGKTFVAWLVDRQNKDHRQLQAACDLLEIGRYQGSLNTLEQILNLKEE